MINLDQLYSIRQKIPKIIRRLFPKISFFKYYFLPTNLKVLPELNYPEKGDIEYQKTLIEKFNNIEIIIVKKYNVNFDNELIIRLVTSFETEMNEINELLERLTSQFEKN